MRAIARGLEPAELLEFSVGNDAPKVDLVGVESGKPPSRIEGFAALEFCLEDSSGDPVDIHIFYRSTESGYERSLQNPVGVDLTSQVLPIPCDGDSEEETDPPPSLEVFWSTADELAGTWTWRDVLIPPSAFDDPVRLPADDMIELLDQSNCRGR